MDTVLSEIIRDSVGLGILLLVLVGVYKLVSRLVGMGEVGLERFLLDFERMSDGITKLADSQRQRRIEGSRETTDSKTDSPHFE